MFIQIDPTIPLVWRDNTSAQVGIDPVRVRFDDIDDLMARALGELVRGTSTQRLNSRLGTSRSVELRRHADPVLTPRRARPLPDVAIIGHTPSARLLSELCAPAFASTVVASESLDVSGRRFDAVILVSDFVVSPFDIQPWLGGDISHLTVVFGESSVAVGPLVKPGLSACMTCVELDRIDSDSAWSAIAPQLWKRAANPSSALVAHAASEIMSMLVTGSGYSTRIDSESLERVMRPHSIHRLCGCQGLPTSSGQNG